MKARILMFISILLITIGSLLLTIGCDKKESKITTKEYECTYTLSDSVEMNAFNELHTYDIVTDNNDLITKVTIYEKYTFKDYDTYYRYYNKYNVEDTGYKILGSDPDAYLLILTKEETPNILYEEYLKNSSIDTKLCKEKDNKSKQEKKVSKKDNTYVCKYENLVTYITVDSNNLITSVMNGVTHKMSSLEEYNKIKSGLVENDVLKYIYDEANLSITQLNKMIVSEYMDYDKYITNSLRGYTCSLEK